MPHFRTPSRAVLAISGAAIALLAALIAAYIYLAPPALAPSESTESAAEAGAATTTEEGGEESAAQTPKPEELPPEPAFTLPAGATAIDDYAFTMDGEVYFRSIKFTDPLRIPDADAATFGKLASFSTYSAGANACGGNAIYTYYGDAKHVYFYQVWRTPTFRTSQIEVIVGAKKKDFVVTGAGTAKDSARSFSVTHQVTASSTCLLALNRTTL